MSWTGFTAALYSLWDCFWNNTLGKIFYCCGAKAVGGAVSALVAVAVAAAVMTIATDLSILQKECSYDESIDTAPLNDVCSNALPLQFVLVPATCLYGSALAY